jgi:hypothetical protein
MSSFQPGRLLRTILLGELPADCGGKISVIFREYCDNNSLLPTSRGAIWTTVTGMRGAKLAITVVALDLWYR